jgi:NADH:ubiquinone oxidoreductase subunit 2 (subunit N)
MNSNLYTIHDVITYGLVLFYFGLFFYFIATTTIFVMLFDSKTWHIDKTESISYFWDDKFYRYTIIFTLLSFAGTPPLLGFLLKISQIIFFCVYTHPIISFIFIIYNSTIMYFYFINFKYSKSLKKGKKHSFRFPRKNKKFKNILYFLNFINLFSIIYTSHLLEFILYMLLV